MRSPKVAIITALPKAPIPMAVRSNPCPAAPTFRISRAKTGSSVVNGTMKSDASIVIRSPVRTVSLRQLNFQPSTMLWPNDTAP